MNPQALARRDRRIRAFILFSGAIIVLCFVVGDPLIRTLVKRDMAGAPVRQGVGTVVTVIQPTSVDLDHPVAGHVVVRFRGGLYAPKIINGIERLRPDGPARILFKAGRSGRLYIQSVGPP